MHRRVPFAATRPAPLRLGRCLLWSLALGVAGCSISTTSRQQTPPSVGAATATEYQRRVSLIRDVPGFVALWDFVKREDGINGRERFTAHQAVGQKNDFALDAINYVQTYWNQGRPATYDDFPLLGRGPFGQAIRIRDESDADFRPTLLVPRHRLHDSGLDAKGPGQSVSMLAWVIREGGNHAIAGIWHEGTDLVGTQGAATTIEAGRRQYAIFAGLAANAGASAAHVSENGARSFGDRYARNLAVTPGVIAVVAGSPAPDELDGSWHVMGFTFDRTARTVTAYLDGEAHDYWIEQPFAHPFFKWPARAWQQAHLARLAGVQPDEDPSFPRDQFYEPLETQPLARAIVSETADERIELQRFAFTQVRVTMRRESGASHEVVHRELVALRANPFWFDHDLYSPPRLEDGGPFTIGRVIHSSRSVGFTGYIGGVAVFSRALTGAEMKRLSAVGESGPIAVGPDFGRQPHPE